MEQYTLVRSDRRTLALVIGRDGALTARAPRRMPVREVERFIALKADWIARQRARLLAEPPAWPSLTPAEGERLPLLGQPLRLRYTAVRRVTRQDDLLLLPATATTLAPLKRWARAQAEAELWPRLRAQCARLGVQPRQAKLSTARSRWGSMSGDGTLRLSIPLVFCPPEVIDYVIVHELCHIAHPNHSPAFWQAVTRAWPSAPAQRAWLRRNASLIRILG